MMALFKKNSSSLPLIVMVTLFAGMGLIVWLGILPFQGYITEKADGIQEFHTSRENRERQMGKLPELQNQYERILKDEKKLNILLSENQIVEFVKTLEGLARDTGTVVRIEAKSKDAIEVKKPAKPAKKAAESETDEVAASSKKAPATIMESLPYDRFLHVNIIVDGEYKNIMSFLHKVETLPLGLDIVSLSMEKRDEEELRTTQAAPGRNPFAILSDGASVAQEAVPDAPVEQALGTLEATFDTVIYLREEKQ